MSSKLYNQLSNHDIDKKLQGSYLKRIGEYSNNCTPIEFFCIKHHEKFKSTWGNVLSKLKRNVGCLKCNKEKTRLSNEIIDKRLEGRNIKRIGNYTTANEKIEWEMDDGYRWFSTPANVLTKTKFKKKRQILSNEVVDKRLEGREIKRISDYISKNNSKLLFLCLRCSHEWEAICNEVVNRKCGCPSCSWSKEEKYFKKFIEDNIKLDLFNTHKCFLIDDKKVIPDFYIEKHNRKIIIEYNGIQHYKPIKYFGGEERFKKQKERDENLRLYCKNNNFEYYELPYYINREVNEKFLLETLGGTQ